MKFVVFDQTSYSRYHQFGKLSAVASWAQGLPALSVAAEGRVSTPLTVLPSAIPPRVPATQRSGAIIESVGNLVDLELIFQSEHTTTPPAPEIFSATATVAGHRSWYKGLDLDENQL
jgi:hypothetical protein